MDGRMDGWMDRLRQTQIDVDIPRYTQIYVCRNSQIGFDRLRQIDRQTDRQVDRQMDRQVDGQIDQIALVDQIDQIDRQIDRYIDR